MATESAAEQLQAVQPDVVPEGFKVLKEGQASILLRGNEAFYNEAQVTNRDLSISVLRQFLPILAQDHAEGKFKKARQQRQQQRRVVKAGAEGEETLQTAGKASQEVEAAAGAAAPTSTTEQENVQAAPMETDASGENSRAGDKDEKSDDKQDGNAEKKPYVRPATVLEGLAASGLRSIRYAMEIPNIKRIDGNDLDKAVCESMRRNVAFNGGEPEKLIRVLHSDARITMMTSPLEYDVIDLDPYGTPSQLLDSAVQSVAEGGLLAITATDMANLCGNNNVSCWSNYGAYPIHRAYCHEQALRILLGCVETHANRYKRYIKPVLSVSIDFYIRVFVRVFTSAAAVKDAPCRLSYLWQSSGCDSFWLQPVGHKKTNGNSIKYMPGHGPGVPDMKCPDTGSGYLMGGPIWSEPIHDHEFVKGLLESLDRDKSRYAQYARIRGLLTSVAEELPDAPLYYSIHDICKTAKCVPFKSEIFRSALINAGYRVSGSHANPLAIKTNAPPNVIWDIIRCWVKQHPVNMKDKDKDTYGAKILAKEPQLQASFARAAGAIKKADNPRFVQNPAYWGPKARHGRPQVQRAVTCADKAEDDAAGGEQPEAKRQKTE